MTRPLLFVDVDGVLHCLGATAPAQRYRCPNSFQLTIPDGTRQRLARLLEVFDPVWSTAWTTDAHDAFRVPLGLSEEPWPVLNWGTYKLPAIEEFAGDRPWAWIDDEALWELDKLGRDHISPNLLINPDPLVGITDTHVERLLGFAADVGAVHSG